MTVLSVGRADNWLVDTGSHQAENGGLSEFGKVRWLGMFVSPDPSLLLSLPNLLHNYGYQNDFQAQGLNNAHA